MGHQVNFFLMPEDTRLLEQRLREECSVVFLDGESRGSTPVRLPGLEVSEFGKTRLRVMLAQPEDLKSVILRHVPQQGYWAVESDRSPVIELDRCYYDGKILRAGRLYYQRQFAEDGVWVEKPEVFQAWARKVFSVTRKTLQKLPDRPYYVGPHALAGQEQGRVKLMVSTNKSLLP
ncbi:hypothetical protein [Archangium lansingense]|uniref:Uncharacterized protein n=1 Tax=Archangium lansingense TaxID=2995310 RepID=A0ABT4ALW4_9BACT|nr:hypothetical protein [Archangium lansinium]MCY1082159.1 hypothetical protein [Archangium lansinium]